MRFLEIFVFPPGISLVLLVTAIVLWRKRKAAHYLVIAAAITLYLPSMTLISDPFLRLLEHPPLKAAVIGKNDAQVIVILGAGRSVRAPEYGKNHVSHYTMQRIRYTAWLARKTRLPVLVSSGNPSGSPDPEAITIKQILESDFNIKVDYLETRSRSTFENAVCTKQILKSINMKKVFLVTHAWHMPRAASAFKRAGIEVIPAPTGYIGKSQGLGIKDILPRTQAIQKVNLWLHEALGIVWYKFKSFDKPDSCPKT